MVRDTVARTFFGAGQIYQAHQQPAKAAELFRKAAKLDAQTPIYRAALEAHYLQSKDLAAGAAAFEQLAAEQPDCSLNYLFLGRLRARLEQVDAAAAAYRKVQELAPDWPEGYRALAELYLRANREPAQARQLAERVVKMAPSAPNYYLLGFACAKNNDRSGAVKALEQAVKLSPGEARYRQLLDQLKQAP
jgi:tetratricopeptide (TPR) repeat protein